MSIQVQGASGIVAEVDQGGRAIRASRRPREYGIFGSYRKSLLSGTMAAGLAANAPIFAFRWIDATRIALIHRIILDGLAGSATAFTAGFGQIRVVPARAFTASDTGGTAGVVTGNNGKLRTNMGTTLAPDIRIASTAALGAGTRTLDSDAIGQASLTFGTVVSVQYTPPTGLALYDESVNDHPIVLATNEGFEIQATVPATGTWQFGVTVEWSEVASF